MMHSRRRAASAATAALLPRIPIGRRSNRLDSMDSTDSVGAGVPPVTRANEPIGLAYLSSPSSLSSDSSSNGDMDNILTSTSSSASNSSDSPVTSDAFRSTLSVLTRQNAAVLRKSRGRTRSGTPIPIQTTNVAGSSRRRAVGGGVSRLRSTDQSNTTETTARSSLGGVVRCPIPVGSKPVSTRSRRRLAQPASNDLVSPSLNPPSPTNNHSLNDSVQIVGIESLRRDGNSQSTRLRLGRTGALPVRSNLSGSLARRTLIGSRLNPSPLPPPPPLAATESSRRTPSFSSNAPVRRTRSAADTTDLQAALVAARRRPGSPTDDDDCVICLCEKSNRSVVLPCMHTFCFDCIHRWLTINPSCPLCKRMAQRVIHSVLSDTEFTELLVSDLQAQRNVRRGVTGLPASFDLEEELLNAQATEDQQQQHRRHHQQSHHHYHYHLGSPPVRFLDYLNGMAQGNSSATSLFFQPIVIPPVNPLSRTASLTGTLDADHPRPAFRWNSETGLLVESHRSLLTTLVNNALRRRNSSLLDGLLLRQLVYVFGFDSIPIVQEPELERDITPNFLATNETQRQRLQTFVRRDLRVLAPWLAYRSSELNSSSSNTAANPATDEPQAGSAITAPLICGAPGLLADTSELDLITERVVQHFTTVPMTNESALIQLLNSFPALQQPLVPTNYLSHFCSEVIQFARYSGTLEQYDYAACLYRRRLSANATRLGGTAAGRPVARSQRPDPRLAVYMASACWPRLRPGFAEPQGMITHPLINWLLQRLFVHSVSGSIHPVRLPGTGEYPATVLPEPLIFQSSRVVCHPHCSRLSSLSRALLEALPTTIRLRSATTTAVTPPDSVSHLRGRDGVVPGGFTTGSTAGGMTSVELFPNRLVYQRILSELIDQARFSEALSSHFNRYHLDVLSSSSQPAPTFGSSPSSSSGEAFSRSSLDRDFLLDFIGGWMPERSVESTRHEGPLNLSSTDHLQSALDVHGRALRRLSGLLLLFTARVPSGLRTEHDEDVISELLHTPLMPMTLSNPTAPVPVIDLTTVGSGSSATRTDGSRSNHAHSSRTSVTTGSHAVDVSDPDPLSTSDWQFLLRPAPVSWASVNSQPATAATNIWLPSLRQTEASENDEHQAAPHQQEEMQAIWSPQLPPVTNTIINVDQHDTSPYRVTTSPAQTESGWRVSTNPCVIISSDSSSDSSEEDDGAVDEVRVIRPQSPYAMTADESDDGIAAQTVLKNDDAPIETTAIADSSEPVGHPDILTVEDNTSRLSLGPAAAASSDSLQSTCQHAERTRIEEPMDVDEKPNDGDGVQAMPSTAQRTFPLLVSGSKRPLPSASKDQPDSIDSAASSSKSLRKSEPSVVYIPPRPQLVLYKSRVKSNPIAVNWITPYGISSSRLGSYHHRHRYHRHTRSRSPIILESSESDCELLRESIHVYSDSSSCSSSSSSCSSTANSRSSSRSNSVSTTSRERSRSPYDSSILSSERRSKRATDSQSRHRRCHHHHRHRHHCHGCHRHRKCRHRSKRHRYTTHHRRCSDKQDKRHHRKQYKSPPPRHCCSRLRSCRRPRKTVQLNSTSSPILISDEESDHNESMPNLTRETDILESPAVDSTEPAGNQNGVLSPTSEVRSTVSDPPDPHNQPDRICMPEPCCSHSGMLVSESSTNNACATEVAQEEAEDPLVHASDELKQRIFEPSNADDFYQFLARLESNHSSDPTHHIPKNTPPSSPM